MKFSSQAVPKLKNKISCLLPMVVITVPAKKKELPKSQWLIWLEVFPNGIIPAFIAATICCKFKKKFISTHESHGGIKQHTSHPRWLLTQRDSILRFAFLFTVYNIDYTFILKNLVSSIIFAIKWMDMHEAYHIVPICIHIIH